MSLLSNFNESRKSRRVIFKFVNKLGLLYLGSVDQRYDDHTILKGFTASASHHDNIFCVGSSDNYDIALVDRKDTIKQYPGKPIFQNWLIMSFRLHTKQYLPHIFITANNSNEKAYLQFFDIFQNYQKINFGIYEVYPTNFIEKFSVYSNPSLSIKTQQLLPADVMRIFSEHFWPLSIEICEGYLYIYSSSLKISESLLSAMYQNGLWLAGQVDYQAELI